MLSLCYLMAYESGEIIPGDDMAGAAYRWTAPDELGGLSISPPADQAWLAARAIELYNLWSRQDVSLWHEIDVVP